jgi:DNA-binding CsgD family transcriptional regulator
VSTPPATPGASLSPREREVAELVLQGKTYVEIGESIFISPRTAEHHIARIRRRLGATTRSDLIAKLRAALTAEDSSARTRVSA